MKLILRPFFGAQNSRKIWLSSCCLKQKSHIRHMHVIILASIGIQRHVGLCFFGAGRGRSQGRLMRLAASLYILGNTILFQQKGIKERENGDHSWGTYALAMGASGELQGSFLFCLYIIIHFLQST